MLDFTLASLYGVEVRTLNQAVRRNIDRFPDGLVVVAAFYGEQGRFELGDLLSLVLA